MGFALSASATHFYLNYNAPPRSAPSALTLAVGGRPIAQLKVMLHEELDNGKEELLVADLPGDMLARLVFPAMIQGQMLSAIVGERYYAVPIAHFDSVVQELQDCALKALAKQSRIS